DRECYASRATDRRKVTRCSGRDPLPAVVREGLVGLRHLVRVVLLLHCVAAALGGIDELSGQALAHRLFTALTRVRYDPAHRQGDAPLRPDFDRNLVGCAADSTALHLELRLHVVESLTEDLHRILLEALADDIERAVEDALGDGLLAVEHQR